MDDRNLWIFGYGSLIFRPAFDYLDRRVGWVSGWTRRFWQGSTDHRGTPGAPGRVVTVLPEPTARCWGVAYCVAERHRQRVLEALDHREQGGYLRQRVHVHFPDGDSRADVLMYVATPENPNYLGPAEPVRIAGQVRRSTGPSGANSEYLLQLAQALRAMGAEDPHVFELESLVREASTAPGLMARREP